MGGIEKELREKAAAMLIEHANSPEMYKRMYDFAFGVCQGTDTTFEEVYIKVKKAIFYAEEELQRYTDDL